MAGVRLFGNFGNGMVELQTSGWLDRLGYEVEPATFERVFREPDRVRRARFEGAT